MTVEIIAIMVFALLCATALTLLVARDVALRVLAHRERTQRSSDLAELDVRMKGVEDRAMRIEKKITEHDTALVAVVNRAVRR